MEEKSARHAGDCIMHNTFIGSLCKTVHFTKQGHIWSQIHCLMQYMQIKGLIKRYITWIASKP